MKSLLIVLLILLIILVLIWMFYSPTQGMGGFDDPVQPFLVNVPSTSLKSNLGTVDGANPSTGLPNVTLNIINNSLGRLLTHPIPTNMWLTQTTLTANGLNIPTTIGEANLITPVPYQAMIYNKGVAFQYVALGPVMADGVTHGELVFYSDEPTGGSTSVPRVNALTHLVSAFTGYMNVSLVESLVADPVLGSFDALAANFAYSTSTAGNSGMIISMYQGSPFITAQYYNTTPIISSIDFGTGAASAAWMNIDTVGTSLHITLNVTTAHQVYRIYFLLPSGTVIAPPAYTILTGNSGIQLNQPFSGFIRIAYDFEENSFLNPTPGIMSRIEAGLSAIAMSSTLTLTDTTVSYTPVTRVGNAASVTSLAMFSDGPGFYDALHGQLSLVTGGTTVTLPTSGVGAMILPPMSQAQKAIVINNLNADSAQLSAQTIVPDSYNLGKYLYEIGQLVLYADLLGVTPNQNILSKMQQLMDDLFDGKLINGQGQQFRFDYETQWSGIVPSTSIVMCSLNDPGSQHDPGCCANEYGTGCYNDHHFHYGYYIFASYVLSSHIPNWINGTTSGGQNRKNNVLYWVRDVVNPTSDAFFPMTRNFNWYLGRSYATGVIPNSKTKGEEAALESTNCYVAATLLGQTLGMSSLVTVGKICSMLEVRSFHFFNQTQGYLPYPASTGMPSWPVPNLTILWDDKLEYTTFFPCGGNPPDSFPAKNACIIGITVFPYGLHLNYVLGAWVRGVAQALLAAIGAYPLGFGLLAKAIMGFLDPTQFPSIAAQIQAAGDTRLSLTLPGLSLTNILIMSLLYLNNDRIGDASSRGTNVHTRYATTGIQRVTIRP